MGMGAAAGVGRAVQGMANSPRVQTSGQGKGAGAVQPTQPQVPAQGGKTAAPGTILNPNNPNNVPMAGGKAPGVVQPGQSPYTPIGLPPAQIPPQGGKGNMPLPADYQSRYGNYGFDSGLQNYLDQQYVGSTRDAGVSYQYDPSTQTFTGGTMAGQYNPIPLSVMQQAAGGNRDVLNPYFQSRFPQPPAAGIRFPSDFTPPAPGQTYINPNIKPAGFTGTLPPRLQQPAPVMPRPVPQVMPRQPTPRPVPQVMPRGLAGLRGRR